MAILLIMAIALVPSFFMKRPQPVAPVVASTANVVEALADSTAAVAAEPVTLDTTATSVQALVEDTIVVRSGLYEYRFSTRGAQMIGASFLRYRSMNAAHTANGERRILELIPTGASMLDNRILVGDDTVHYDAYQFSASTNQIEVTSKDAAPPFSCTVAGRRVSIVYGFLADDNRVEIAGRIGVIGINGATVLIRMCKGFRDTETNVAENHRES